MSDSRRRRETALGTKVGGSASKPGPLFRALSQPCPNVTRLHGTLAAVAWAAPAEHRSWGLQRTGRGGGGGFGAIMRVTTALAATFDIRADRPFLFVLAESATRAPLFMGLVRDPR